MVEGVSLEAIATENDDVKTSTHTQNVAVSCLNSN